MKVKPKLRFKGFGENQTLSKLGNYVDLISGYAFQSVLFSGSGKRLITPKNFTKFGSAYFDDRNTKYTVEKVDAKFICKPGDLLILLTDLTPSMELLGKPLLLAEKDGDVLLNQRIVKVLTNSVDKRFLSYFLQTESYHKYIKETSTGTTVRHSSNRIILNLKVAFPALPEQNKIASFLSVLDDMIRQLTYKKELLEQYKKGVMQQLYSGRLRFKDERGMDYPKWQEKTLGEVAEIVGGGTPDTSNLSYWDGQIQWFTPTEISKRFVSASRRTITSAGLENSSAKLLPAGTLLLTSRATIAEVSIARQECTTNQGFQSLIVDKHNDSVFVYYWIKNNVREFVRKSQGSTFPEIGRSEVARIRILLPSKPEQHKIAGCLTSLDAKIDSLESQLKYSQTFKKGLLQQMFV